ncbi:MAG: hypothetical protein U0V72_12185 [Cytophagales bacterium]
MRNFTFLFIILISKICLANFTTFKGVYQGKNVIIQNPAVDKTFCIEEIFLNNVSLEINTKVPLIEINLLKLQAGDTLNIKIKHGSSCTPKLLNPHVIKQNSAFRFLKFEVNATNLTWQTRGEKINTRLYIEQYLNSNWAVVHELPSKGLSTQNEYTIHEFHCSGINKYRIRYEESEGVNFYSSIVEFRSNKARVNFYPKRITSIVKFSRDVAFEVLDKEGTSVKKGYANEIDMSEQKEGVYYLLFDNRKEKVLKK